MPATLIFVGKNIKFRRERGKHRQKNSLPNDMHKNQSGIMSRLLGLAPAKVAGDAKKSASERQAQNPKEDNKSLLLRMGPAKIAGDGKNSLQTIGTLPEAKSPIFPFPPRKNEN